MIDKYLVDSNIIIYHLNNNIVATNFLEQNIHNSCISNIEKLECLSHNFINNEEKYAR
jgi:predicted nucleic acid-binding protein